MITLTKEWLMKTIAELEEERDATPGVVNEDAAMAIAAMKLAMASLEAEPVSFNALRDAVAEVSGGPAMEWSDIYKGHQAVPFINFNSLARIVEKFRTATPAPVAVPDEYVAAVPTPTNLGYEAGGNACRAAMLQGAEPVSQSEELPVAKIKPVADLYGITSPIGSETSFTFDAVEARDFISGGWSCQEYVELERYQEAMTGNSPAIPDGYALVPIDISPQMMRAVQLNSELGEYAAANLTGAYSLFREFWDVAIAAAPQQEA